MPRREGCFVPPAWAKVVHGAGPSSTHAPVPGSSLSTSSSPSGHRLHPSYQPARGAAAAVHRAPPQRPLLLLLVAAPGGGPKRRRATPGRRPWGLGRAVEGGAACAAHCDSGHVLSGGRRGRHTARGPSASTSRGLSGVRRAAARGACRTGRRSSHRCARPRVFAAAGNSAGGASLPGQLWRGRACPRCRRRGAWVHRIGSPGCNGHGGGSKSSARCASAFEPQYASS
jgi:hypothetical protein